METLSPHKIRALNNAESSENRIHSDEIALKYGFTGALVSGVNVFGYLTQALVKVYGEDWLSKGIMDVIFIKPAYQDDLLTIRSDEAQTAEELHQRHHLTSAFDKDNRLLAKLESWLPQEMPAVSELASLESGELLKPRQEISWDLIQPMQPAPYYIWQPSQADNQERVDAQRDPAALYQGDNGYIHPYFLLEACNKALMRQFILPAWIHTGSRLILHRPITLGSAIEVRAVPTEKWERKGHQFIKLYIAMVIEDVVALEVEHTAIFKIAS